MEVGRERLRNQDIRAEPHADDAIDKAKKAIARAIRSNASSGIQMEKRRTQMDEDRDDF